MNSAQAVDELASMQERIRFLNTLIEETKPAPAPENPYGCQLALYAGLRPCRYDRRAIDRKCDGCNRVTDRDYLASMGLWVKGVSHE